MNILRLYQDWNMPDRQEVRQISVRVPVRVFARLRALQKLYPARSLTELVSDILNSGLDEIEEDLLRIEPSEVDAHGDEYLFHHREFQDRWGTWVMEALREAGQEKQGLALEPSVIQPAGEDN